MAKLFAKLTTLTSRLNPLQKLRQKPIVEKQADTPPLVEDTLENAPQPEAADTSEAKVDPLEAVIALMPRPKRDESNLVAIFEGMATNTTSAYEGWLQLQLSVTDKKWLEENRALHVAIKLKNVFMVKFLSSQGVSVNQPNGQGQTPLLAAIEVKSLSMVRILLAAGAVKSQPNPKGVSPTTLAQSLLRTANHYEKPKLEEIINLVSTFKSIEKGRELFAQALSAIRQRDTDALANTLAQATEYVNDEELAFNVLVHEAVLCGHQEAFKLLADSGLNIDYRDEHNNTPLHCAVLSASRALTEALIQTGSDIQAYGQYGFTALHIAAQRLDGDLVECLLSHGAQTNVEVYGVSSANGDKLPAKLALKEAEFIKQPSKNHLKALALLKEPWPTLMSEPYG